MSRPAACLKLAEFVPFAAEQFEQSVFPYHVGRADDDHVVSGCPEVLFKHGQP